MEKAKKFMERSYPMIHLYGNGSSDGDEQVAKVRIAFSRERDDRGRSEKADGEWTCKIVRSVFSRLTIGIILKETVHFRQLRYTHEMLQMSNTTDW